MTTDDTGTLTLADLPWPAVALATVAYYALGALWFTPLFGRAWDDAIGRPRQGGERFPASYYVVPLVSSASVTVALAVVLVAVGPSGLVDALALGLVVGAGVAFAVSVNNALTPHTPHPFRHGAITGGYHLVGITVGSLVLWSMAG